LASSTSSSNLNTSKLAADAVLQDNSIPRKILLVEDNYFNRQMLEDYLVFWKYQVLSLEFGSGFFQALVEFQPHLVLLDLKLPDVDGYTLLEQLQSSDWGDIPVIVVSAFAFRADQQRALELGARRYFVKPVSLKDLRQAIEDELSRF
jgi:two-component system cell cycle response regulator DivK